MNDFAHEIVFVVPVVFIITTAIVIIASFNYRLKKQLLDSDRPGVDLTKLLSKTIGNDTELLKWGLIFFFGGIGLVLLNYIPYDADSSALPFGIEAIFLAFGFLTYYFLVRKKTPKDQD